MKTLKKVKRRLLAVMLCLCMIFSSNAFGNTIYTVESDAEEVTDNTSLGGGYNGAEF